MEYAGTQLSWPQSEARQAVDDRDAEAEAEANKQRRKVQNRKNQRAHRKYAACYYNPFSETPTGLRLKGRDSGNIQESRPFRVRRWRLDEPDHIPSQEISLASERATTTSFSLRPPHTYTGISLSTAKRTVVLRGSPSTAHIPPPVNLDPQPFTFPLSSDHLLHLI
jgi:hypothetical protein